MILGESELFLVTVKMKKVDVRICGWLTLKYVRAENARELMK